VKKIGDSMFLIFGISQNEKQLNFDQLAICKCCGKYGHVTVWMRYTYFMLFFIPLFKWGKHYYVRMSCCNADSEISPTLGHDIEAGNVTSLNLDDIDFGCNNKSIHRCSNCGFTTTEDFQFCPKCSKPLE